MAVFPFMKKKPQEQQKNYIPVNMVQQYASQGMPEGRIINELKNQGFSPSQVDSALRSVLKRQVSSPRQEMSQRSREMNQDEFPTMQMGGRAPSQEREMPQERRQPMPQRRPEEMQRRPMEEIERRPVEQRQQLPVQEQQQMEIPSRASPAQYTFEEPQKMLGPGLEDITLEEIIEGIVSEKWQVFEERLANFEERDLQLQEQIESMRSSIKDVEKLVVSKEQNMSGQFNEFSGSMSDIQGRIGSIEKVFKDLVPELTDALRRVPRQ
ncbi:MAG: hypothetical protein KJ906_00305 [Nanoarchaeota archaeon]|nr:hypothetical protein [Nanoarchaeota archaeon]